MAQGVGDAGEFVERRIEREAVDDGARGAGQQGCRGQITQAVVTVVGGAAQGIDRGGDEVGCIAGIGGGLGEGGAGGLGFRGDVTGAVEVQHPHVTVGIGDGRLSHLAAAEARLARAHEEPAKAN